MRTPVLGRSEGQDITVSLEQDLQTEWYSENITYNPVDAYRPLFIA